ncbi:MAG: hypothetical protein ABJF04_16215 [Reichenbachiella sp.]|uniref:hypothetical protein n=1 Tax=Reichenbachiella sp. TaxID=2184521 RepID=UPI0032642E38
MTDELLLKKRDKLAPEIYDDGGSDISKVLSDTFTIRIEPYAESYWKRGLSKQRKKGGNTGLPDLKKAFELEPNKATRHLINASIKIIEGNFEAGLNELKKSIKYEKKKERAAVTSGTLKYFQSDFEGAIEEFSKATELNPTDPWNYFYRGNARVRTIPLLVDIKDVVDDYLRAIDNDHPDPAAYFNKAIVMYEHRMKMASLEVDLAFQRSLLDDEDQPKINKEMNGGVFMPEVLDAVEQDLKSVLDFKDKEVLSSDYMFGAHYYLARVNEQRHDFTAAVAEYSNAIEIDESNHRLYALRAGVKIELDNDSEALEDFSEALRLAPNNGSYYCHRGDLLFKLEDYKRALPDFSKVQSAFKNFEKLTADNNKNGLEEWHKQNPNLHRLTYGIEAKIGTSLYECQQFEQAIRFLAYASEHTNPDNEHILLSLGASHYCLGHGDDAIQNFRKAIYVNPQSLYKIIDWIVFEDERTEKLGKDEDIGGRFVSLLENDVFLKSILESNEALEQLVSNALTKNSKELSEYDQRILAALAKILKSKNEEIEKYKSHAIGLNIKEDADEFAKKMGAALDQARNDGFTSIRKISNRFNELSIPAARGGKWTHVKVQHLINRRRQLGLE